MSIVPANVKVEGSDPAIVLIYGFGAAIDWWDDVAPALTTDHRVIRIDLIGHGGTAAPASGYSIERQGALVAAILERVLGGGSRDDRGCRPLADRRKPARTLELIRGFLKLTP